MLIGEAFGILEKSQKISIGIDLSARYQCEARINNYGLHDKTANNNTAHVII